MGPSAAVEVALAHADQPGSFRGAEHGPLPSGMTLLLEVAADSYRILGARRTATRKELRRHMALLVKWLHRHQPGQSPDDRPTDGGRFFSRVTQAWEHLKTAPRREAYDRILTGGSDDVTQCNLPLTAAPKPQESGPQRGVRKTGARRASRRLIIYRVPSDTLFGRLLYYLGRHA